MTDYLTNDTELTAVADAIRTRGGTSAALEWPDGYVDAVGAISGGGATLYKINGVRVSHPVTVTTDGTTYDDDFTGVKMGYAQEGDTVSVCWQMGGRNQGDYDYDSVVNDTTRSAIPCTTRTTSGGSTVYMFTMPASSVTINSYYND